MLGDLVRQINQAGFLLNNLFQLGPDEWRANVRRRDVPRQPGALGQWQHEYCDAATPEAALLGVVAKLKWEHPDGIDALTVLEWHAARAELTKALKASAVAAATEPVWRKNLSARTELTAAVRERMGGIKT